MVLGGNCVLLSFLYKIRAAFKLEERGKVWINLHFPRADGEERDPKALLVEQDNDQM